MRRGSTLHSLQAAQQVGEYPFQVPTPLPDSSASFCFSQAAGLVSEFLHLGLSERNFQHLLFNPSGCSKSAQLQELPEGILSCLPFCLRCFIGEDYYATERKEAEERGKSKCKFLSPHYIFLTCMIITFGLNYNFS